MAISALAAEARPRRITILGSTGSVGCNTVDLIERNPKAYRVEALTARNNVDALADQARRLRPKLAAVADEGSYRELLTVSIMLPFMRPRHFWPPGNWILPSTVGLSPSFNNIL